MRRWLQISSRHCCCFSTRPSSSSSSATSKNCYDLLGVPMCAGQEEIKRAYFRKCKEFHPDVNSSEDGSSEEFQQLKKAYDVLRSSEARASYDAFLIARRHGNSDEISFEQYKERGQQPPIGRESPYEFYYQHNQRDWLRNNFQFQADLRFMIKCFIFLGLATIFIHYAGIWYIRRRRDKYLDSLVPKEELAKSFLRQPDMARMDSAVQRELLGRLLVDNLDEEERRRRENPEYARKKREEAKMAKTTRQQASTREKRPIG